MMDMTIEEGELLGVPEPEHVETIFTALAETVNPDIAGTEGLTRSQSYTWAVLHSAGLISRGDAISGAEGFFSTIGSGLKAMWEYIQKMFKSIWNFFFGKGDDVGAAITKDAEDTIKRNQIKITVLTTTRTANAEEVKKTTTSLHRTLDNIKTQKDLDKFMMGEVEQAKAKLDEVKNEPPVVQARVAKEVAEKIVKINSRTQKGLEEACKKAIDQYKLYQQKANEDHSAELAGSHFQKLYQNWRAGEIEEAKRSITAYVTIPQGMTTLGDAERAQEQLLKVIQIVEGNAKSISIGIKSDVLEQMHKLQAKVNSPDTSDAGREQFNKSLIACKRVLAITTEVIVQLRETSAAVKRISNMINRLFGIATA